MKQAMFMLSLIIGIALAAFGWHLILREPTPFTADPRTAYMTRFALASGEAIWVFSDYTQVFETASDEVTISLGHPYTRARILSPLGTLVVREISPEIRVEVRP